jgi:hypothetical protein
MKADGRYAFVTVSEQKTIDANLDAIGQLFEQRGDTVHMSGDERVQLFHDQEQVNAILTERDSQRKVCTMEKPLGSHMVVQTCETYGEIEARHRHSYESMEKALARPQGH